MLAGCVYCCVYHRSLSLLWDLRCGSTLLLWVVFVASIARLERLSLSFQLVRARCAYPICTADICGNTTRCPARAKAKCKPSSNSSTAGPLIIVPHGSSPWHSPPTAVATHFTCRHTDKLAVSRHDPVNRRPCPRVIGFPAKFRTEPGWLPFEPFFLCVCYSAVFTMHLVRSCWIKAILLTSPSLD